MGGKIRKILRKYTAPYLSFLNLGPLLQSLSTTVFSKQSPKPVRVRPFNRKLGLELLENFHIPSKAEKSDLFDSFMLGMINLRQFAKHFQIIF